MHPAASTCIAILLLATVPASAIGQKDSANSSSSGKSVTNLDGTGKKLSASSMNKIVKGGSPAMSTATDWCTLDPLPNPLPSNYVELVPSPYPLPNVPATSGVNRLWLTPKAPKKTWCLVKNEPESEFNQCTLDPARRCVDGDYFVINVKSNQGITWINFTNQHSDKVRLIRLIWEP